MNELTAAVLDKVRKDARAIVAAAEAEAGRELDKARQRREERFQAERKRRLAEAEAEAGRILAEGVMEARNTLAAAKAAIMDEIVARARRELDGLAGEREPLARLIAEAVDRLGEGGKVIVGVASRDLELAREIIGDDERLAEAVGELVERSIDGGAVVESEDGSTLVDNSYAARLEILVPRILTRFARELF